MTTVASLLAFAVRPLPPPSAAVVRDPSRARVACHLCSAIGVAGEAELVALRHRARETCYRLDRDYRPTAAVQRERMRVATAVWAAIMERPEADRIGVLVAAVRELLTDAPACCLPVDRAVRDAARRFEREVTAEHEATAAAIIAREVRL